MCCTATGRFFLSRWLKPRPWTQVCGKRRHGRRLAKPRRPGSRLPSHRCWTWRATRAGGGSRKAQAKIRGLHRFSRRPRSAAFRKRRPAGLPPWARPPSISPPMARLRPDANTHPRTSPARTLHEVYLPAIRRSRPCRGCGGHAVVQRFGRHTDDDPQGPAARPAAGALRLQGRHRQRFQRHRGADRARGCRGHRGGRGARVECRRRHRHGERRLSRGPAGGAEPRARLGGGYRCGRLARARSEGPARPFRAAVRAGKRIAARGAREPIARLPGMPRASRSCFCKIAAAFCPWRSL